MAHQRILVKMIQQQQSILQIKGGCGHVLLGVLIRATDHAVVEGGVIVSICVMVMPKASVEV